MVEKTPEEKYADSLFASDITPSERAAFELGIKMGTLFHIAVGIPVSKKLEVRNALERALEKSIASQPYVKNVRVKIIGSDGVGNSEKNHPFDYGTVGPENLDAEITVEYNGIGITGRLRLDRFLRYPIMYISDIRKLGKKEE